MALRVSVLRAGLVGQWVLQIASRSFSPLFTSALSQYPRRIFAWDNFKAPYLLHDRLSSGRDAAFLLWKAKTHPHGDADPC